MQYSVYLSVAIILLLLCENGNPWRRRRRRRCDTTPCTWHWGSCSKTCGSGTQSPVKTRNQGACGSCSLPATRSCNTQCCPVNCVWAGWGNWGSCSRICGGGTQTRGRGYSTSASCNGRACTGSSSESRQCNAQCCPVDCVWLPWGSWGSCSLTCGGGSQTKSRGQTPAVCGGASCKANTVESRVCNSQCCPVNCAWSDWISWGSCSATCAGGVQVRSRVQSPPMSCNGNVCIGDSNESKRCNTQCCPVNCVWGAWDDWDLCSVSCGGGIQNRNRVKSPLLCGGSDCVGASVDSRQCNAQCCPVNCKWNEWSEWTICTRSCGTGTQSSTRNISVQAFCDGIECSGPVYRSRDCNKQCCPVNCVWDSWSPWGACSKTCENGSQSRVREKSVEASCNGNPCEEGSVNSRSCNDVCCPVHCEWKDWNAWTICSKTCGTGIQSRKREVKTAAVCKGEECTGEKDDERNCNEICCPVDCVLSIWTSWSECSVSCGGGSQARYRSILTQPECNGRQCDQELVQHQQCNENCIHGLMRDGSCSCEEGWNGTCCNYDIDECIFTNCTANSECSNTDGSYNCICYHGYTKNGTLCEDVDECHQELHDCHAEAECINANGDYECRCNPGFIGNGNQCDDVDECEGSDYEGSGNESVSYSGFDIHCHELASCSNTYGSYICTCYIGFTGDGITCDDIDECALFASVSEDLGSGESSGAIIDPYASSRCDSNATCTNRFGNYSCACTTGYKGNGFWCIEINECSSDPCKNKGKCIDMMNLFSCVCNDGYTGSLCETDVNECDQATHRCDVEYALCRNTNGSYSCICKDGFSGDGNTCTDIDECAIGFHSCKGDGFQCKNTEGGYECACNEYLELIDGECKEKLPADSSKQSQTGGLLLPLPILIAVIVLSALAVIAIIGIIARAASKRGNSATDDLVASDSVVGSFSNAAFNPSVTNADDI